MREVTWLDARSVFWLWLPPGAIVALGCSPEGAPPQATPGQTSHAGRAAPARAPVATATAIPAARPRATPGTTATTAAPGPMKIDPEQVQLQSGYAYWVKLPDAWLPFASDHSDPFRGRLVLKEDGKALGPNNVPVTTVQGVGRGNDLDWGSWLCFSTSDNTAPRSNGRTYAVILSLPAVRPDSSPALRPE